MSRTEGPWARAAQVPLPTVDQPDLYLHLRSENVPLDAAHITMNNLYFLTNSVCCYVKQKSQIIF